MATPFAAFANCRMLWVRPAAPQLSLREGVRPAADQVVLEAFAKLQGPGGEQPSGGRAIGAATATTYLTRWARLPTGASWLDEGDCWEWVETGLRPEGLPRGEKLQAFIGDLSILPATTDGEHGWLTVATMPGPGGIDGLVRAAAGDKLTGTFAAGR